MPSSSAYPSAAVIAAESGTGTTMIRLDGMEPGEFAAHGGAGGGDVYVVDQAVGPREVHVLEHAERLFFLPERPFAADAAVINDDDLARLDLADEFRVDEIERARFRRQHVGILQPCRAPAAGSRKDRARR